MGSDASGILLPYQRTWVADQSRFKIGMWSRQVGKTFSSTLEIVLDCVGAEAQGRRARWVILSRGERQAREAMEEGVKRHLNALQAAFTSLEYDWNPAIKALEVVLPGGSRITALPANPDTARGFSASVLLDEFAFHADSRKIWQALFPVISAGHRLIVVSTPNGKGNKFYELMTSQDSAWSRHVVDIHRAVADGLRRNVDELKAGIADDDAWRQEYELEWLDEASAWLPHDLITACEHEHAGDPSRYTGGPVFAGVDIAARRDLFAAWALEAVGDVLWCREMVTRRRASFAEQADVLADFFRRYRITLCRIDQTGMGEAPVEAARRQYGARVEGVLFTGPAKLDLATAIRQGFEDRKVRIPAGVPEIRADLHRVKRINSATGAPRFVAESGDDHADRFWSLALALSAAAGLVEYPSITLPAVPTRETVAGLSRYGDAPSWRAY